VITGSNEDDQRVLFYVHMAQKMREMERTTMHVDFSHLTDFPHEDPQFMTNVVTNFYRFEPDLREGLSKFMMAQSGNSEGMNRSYFQVAIYNLPQMMKIRDLRTANLGRLISIYGTVTRTTDAKPELITGTFKCMNCD
jgi:DNA replication licensing factor MCM6